VDLIAAFSNTAKVPVLSLAAYANPRVLDRAGMSSSTACTVAMAAHGCFMHYTYI